MVSSDSLEDASSSTGSGENEEDGKEDGEEEDDDDEEEDREEGDEEDGEEDGEDDDWSCAGTNGSSGCCKEDVWVDCLDATSTGEKPGCSPLSCTCVVSVATVSSTTLLMFSSSVETLYSTWKATCSAALLSCTPLLRCSSSVETS